LTWTQLASNTTAFSSTITTVTAPAANLLGQLRFAPLVVVSSAACTAITTLSRPSGAAPQPDSVDLVFSDWANLTVSDSQPTPTTPAPTKSSPSDRKTPTAERASDGVFSHIDTLLEEHIPVDTELLTS
jgi:hypothetical protein